MKKNIRHYMRLLHRDIGFFVLGITVIYCLSGLLLLYRDTDLLKSENKIERTLQPNMDEGSLSAALRMRGFKVIENNSETIVFQNGTYNKNTGLVEYIDKAYPMPVKKAIDLHKLVSSNAKHWFALIYGFMLLFLAVSSLWMFDPKTKHFRRGLLIASAGVLFTLLLLFL